MFLSIELEPRLEAIRPRLAPQLRDLSVPLSPEALKDLPPPLFLPSDGEDLGSNEVRTK